MTFFTTAPLEMLQAAIAEAERERQSQLDEAKPASNDTPRRLADDLVRRAKLRGSERTLGLTLVVASVAAAAAFVLSRRR